MTAVVALGDKGSSLAGIDGWAIAAILLAAFVGWVGYQFWREGHTANTERRHFNEHGCALCDEPADLCPRCLDIVRDAFDHEDQEGA
jgi:hypothetical protein